LALFLFLFHLLSLFLTAPWEGERERREREERERGSSLIIYANCVSAFVALPFIRKPNFKFSKSNQVFRATGGK
jgi:hypothetical protein